MYAYVTQIVFENSILMHLEHTLRTNHFINCIIILNRSELLEEQIKVTQFTTKIQLIKFQKV